MHTNADILPKTKMYVYNCVKPQDHYIRCTSSSILNIHKIFQTFTCGHQ